MTNLLRASLLSTLAASFLAFGSPPGAHADGRGNWDGYAWQKIDLADCAAAGTTLVCPPYHEKWDWKRDQWVDITIELDTAGGELRLTQRLTDGDRSDSDHVCVTALAVDSAGNDVIAHHQNWYMTPGSVAEKSFAYSSSRLGDIAVLHIGSKQCRSGADQDDALYARVLAGIHS